MAARAEVPPAAGPDVPGETASSRRRTRGLAVIAAVAVVSATAGVVASQWIRSPAQLAADSAAPTPSVITAQVERRVISTGTVTRGTVGSPSAVPGVPGQPPAGVTAALITRLPAPAGRVLKPGDVVVEVSGRPVFFLPGRLPAYRNLQPGDTGPDVTQLQEGLRSAGLSDNDPTGTFGSSTTAALSSLYGRSGYQPDKSGGLPTSAVDYVNSARSTVVVANASVGDDASKVDIELARGDLDVIVDETTADAPFLHQGAAVDLVAELIGKTASGRITQVLSGQGGAPARAIVTPDKPLTSEWAGQDVRVSVSTTAGSQAVLAVPVSAISLDGNASPHIVALQTDGTQHDEPVTVGATGGGYAQITPRDSSAVTVGTQVVIGVK